MPRPQTKTAALTIGQLARRWAVTVDRVRQLVDQGLLPGAFRIPAAGRFGEAIKIPLDTVLYCEQERWLVSSQALAPLRRPKSRAGNPALKHFPELSQAQGRDAEQL